MAIVAIFGLIGVVLGGLLTGGTQWLLDRQRERRAVRRAKRLVDGELLHAILFLRSIYKLESKIWPFFPDWNTLLPTTAWEEQRQYLADALDEEEWNVLVLNYAEIAAERVRLAVVSDGPPDTPIPDVVIEQLKTLTIGLARSRKALGGGGGWLDDDPEFQRLNEELERLRLERRNIQAATEREAGPE